MTTESLRGPSPLHRDATPLLEADLRLMADQLRRCHLDRRPGARLRKLAGGLRSFTARHALSVTAMLALAAAVLGLVS